MQLAADPIMIEIAGEAYELRPSLRAAIHLHRRAGDFATLYKAILSDDVSLAAHAIEEGSGSPEAAADFFHAIDDLGVAKAVTPLRDPLLRFVLQLAGHDADADGEPSAATGKPMPFAEFHAALFGIGTGWLGWSPAETLDATAAEILAAQRGRKAFVDQIMAAVFGTAEPEQPAPEPVQLNADGTDPALDRNGLAKLKAMTR